MDSACAKVFNKSLKKHCDNYKKLKKLESILLPNGWTKVGVTSDFVQISFEVFSKSLLQFEDAVLQDFIEITDPDHERFANFYTYNELASKYSVSNEEIQEFKNQFSGWESTQFIEGFVPGYAFIVTTAGELKRQLNIELCKYSDGCNIITRSVSKPPTNLNYVPTNIFTFPKPCVTKKTADNVVLGETPALLNMDLVTEFYQDGLPSQLVDPSLPAVSGIKQAFYTPGFEPTNSGGYLQSDLETYLNGLYGYNTTRVADIIPPDMVNEEIVTKNGVSAEASVDSQMMTGFGKIYKTEQIETSFSDFGSTPSMEGLANQLFAKMLSNPDKTINDPVFDDVAKVISISYGNSSVYQPDQIYLRFLNMIYMELALFGFCVCASSGDTGVYNTRITQNVVNNHEYGATYVIPASIPSIIGVGATMFLPDVSGKMVVENERVASINEFASGSFFTDVFDRTKYAPWQNQMVNDYLNNPSVKNELLDLQKEYKFDPKGCSYPDLVVCGTFIETFIEGKVVETTYGTSLSSPLFATMISIVNYARKLEGKGVLGNVVQVLYKHPEIFRSNIGGRNDYVIGPFKARGFPTVDGFDCPTGLGGPDLKRFVEIGVGL